MSNLFHESLELETIARVFNVMAAADHHVFQVLTKRAERMRDILDSGLHPGRQGRIGDDLWSIKQFPRPHPAGRSDTPNSAPLSRET
jgi:hypothetical protein